MYSWLLKKNTKNYDENDQISSKFEICKFRKNLFCKVYISIYQQKDNLPVFHYLFS